MASPGSPEVHIEWVYAPLDTDRVRWYSFRGPYPDAKEQAKATEVPHRGSLLRFCTADSRALEAEYRQRQDELDRLWWEEEAALHSKPGHGGRENSTGGAAAGAGAVGAAGGGSTRESLTGGPAGAAAGGGGDGGVASPGEPAGPDYDSWHFFMGGCEGDEPGVLVRSGSFEVDLRCRQLRPCYWPASRHRVLRGAWFVEKGGEWVPLTEPLAEQLEEGYRGAIWLPARGRLEPQLGGGYAARLDLSTHVEKGLYALFASEEEFYLCQETGWAWLRRIGASATAGQQRLRLRRGYEPPASRALLEKEADLRQEELDDASAAVPVSRLVLVVHGIGQKLSAANIAQDAASFRSVLRQVAADQAQQGLLDEAAAGRTEVLPVQWRKQLNIEADELSRQLMPPGIPSLRQTLHSTVVEILLYMSPQHRPEIVASLVTSLNATYRRFLARNPAFEGSVSILAHSLGTVLCYDILCRQPTDGSASPARFPAAAAGTAGATAAAAAGAFAAGPGSPAPMQVSPPASPLRWQQQQAQAAGALPSPGAATPGSQAGALSGAATPGGIAGDAAWAQGGGGAQGAAAGGGEQEGRMVVDLTAESPTAALQQELSRLRSENQRLQLQLAVARADGSGAPGGAPSSPGGGGGAVPLWWQQAQQAQQQPAAARDGYPPRLAFQVDQLVMMGSPLGCFLALRGINQARGTGLGSPGSALLMQLAPGEPVTRDGLPAVRRIFNLFHPYDPVGHRLEPLAQPLAEVQRAAFVPLFKGGKRIHLAMQELSEDVGSAASRFGTTLLSSLAFAKLKGSTKQLQGPPAGEEAPGGSGSAKSAAAAAVAEAAREAAEAAAEEEAARRLTGHSKSTPALRASLGGGVEEAMAVEEGASEAALQFGALEQRSFGELTAVLSAEGSREGGSLFSSPTHRQLAAQHAQQQQQQQQQQAAKAGAGALSPAAGGSRPASFDGGGSSGSAGPAGVARVADGAAAPGSRTAQGRLDFVMQESSLENQYLSALSAHFSYWSSPDVALFVLRAVHGLDVLTGASKQQQQQQPAQGPAAVAAAGGQASPSPERARGRQTEPTSPRQHLIALP